MSNGEKLTELTVHGEASPGVSRRQAMQWVLATVAATALRPSFGPRVEAAPAPMPAPIGYGTDPNLLKIYKPGDIWPLTLTKAQRATAVVLADVILPKDALGPAASELGVVDMLDEWISSPYPGPMEDREPVKSGLLWLETESTKRFSHSFGNLEPVQQYSICDDICFQEAAKPEFKEAADFFRRFRSICAAAYYSTPEGWKAIGYVGNVPLEKFEGPPDEVLKKLGVTQTVV